eukprot:854386-Pelagomonas_calceolata.AAC.1
MGYTAPTQFLYVFRKSTKNPQSVHDRKRGKQSAQAKLAFTQLLFMCGYLRSKLLVVAKYQSVSTKKGKVAQNQTFTCLQYLGSSRIQQERGKDNACWMPKIQGHV